MDQPRDTARRNPFVRWLPIAAALGFIGFFITIIVIANRGEGKLWWGFIDSLPYGDKIGHVCLVGTLSFLCNLAISKRSGRRIVGLITPVTLVILILLSAEEISQAFIPSRTCDLFDWLSDLAGLAIGQWVALKLKPRHMTDERGN